MFGVTEHKQRSPPSVLLARPTISCFQVLSTFIIRVLLYPPLTGLMIKGNGWTGAHSWLDTWYDQGANPQRSNAQTMIEVNDPINKMIFEVHQYFGKYASSMFRRTGRFLSTYTAKSSNTLRRCERNDNGIYNYTLRVIMSINDVTC